MPFLYDMNDMNDMNDRIQNSTGPDHLERSGDLIGLVYFQNCETNRRTPLRSFRSLGDLGGLGGRRRLNGVVLIREW